MKSNVPVLLDEATGNKIEFLFVRYGSSTHYAHWDTIENWFELLGRSTFDYTTYMRVRFPDGQTGNALKVRPCAHFRSLEAFKQWAYSPQGNAQMQYCLNNPRKIYA